MLREWQFPGANRAPERKENLGNAVLIFGILKNGRKPQLASISTKCFFVSYWNSETIRDRLFESKFDFLRWAFCKKSSQKMYKKPIVCHPWPQERWPEEPAKAGQIPTPDSNSAHVLAMQYSHATSYPLLSDSSHRKKHLQAFYKTKLSLKLCCFSNMLCSCSHNWEDVWYIKRVNTWVAKKENYCCISREYFYEDAKYKNKIPLIHNSKPASQNISFYLL